jgi:hypothetical protein
MSSQHNAARHLAAILLMLMAGSVPADVYRWVDDTGQVHYGDQPPPGVPAAPVGARPGASTQAPPVAPTAVEPRPSAERYLDARRAEREEAKAAVEARREEQLLRKRQCATARRDLTLFDSGAVIYGYDAKGERYALDPREREQRRKSLQRTLRAACA